MATRLPSATKPPPLASKPILSDRRRPSSVSSAAVCHPLPRISTPAVPLDRTTPAHPKPNLASVWREIQGADDWEDLVEPLNPLLRDEIVRYGEFVLASYKAFDLDPTSRRYLNCMHGKKTMLEKVGLPASGYTVTKYIYATPGVCVPTEAAPCASRWIGYVAVSTDEAVARLGRRDILVSFRGTVTAAEWIANLMSALTPARIDPHDPRHDVKVESGFLSVYTSGDSTCKFTHGSCREQLLSELSRLLAKHKGEDMSITLAGHSMGSSLALLLGYDIAELGLNRTARDREVPITVYSFGGPRVGNAGFKQRCEELGVKVLRVVNVNDLVTKMPGVLLNENFRAWGGRYELPWSCSCYAHVGVELALDFFKVKNPICVHDLDAYLGLLKCPMMARAGKNAGGKNGAVDIVEKVMSLMSEFNLGGQAWQEAARNFGSLVQSLRSIGLTPWLESR